MTYIKKGSTGTLIRNYRYDVAFSIVTKVILFINSIITVRVLGLEGFGNLAFLGAIPLLMSILITQGNREGLSRFLPEYKEQKSHFIQALVRRAIIHNLIYSFAVISFFLLVKGAVLGFFRLDDVSRAVTIIILTNTFFIVMEQPFITFLEVNYDNLFINIVTLMQNLLTIIGFYILYFMGLISITKLLLLATLAQIVRFVFCAVRYRRLNPQNCSVAIPENEIKDFRKYSGKMFLYSLLNFFTSQRGVIYFIQLYLGPVSVGLFRVIQKLTDSFKNLLMPRSLNALSTTRAIERFSSSGGSGLNEFMEKYFSLNCLGSTVIILFLMSNIVWLTKLFSANFFDFHLFAALYLIYAFSVFIKPAFRKYMLVYKKNEWFIYIKIFEFIVLSLLANLYLSQGLWVIALILLLISFLEIGMIYVVLQKNSLEFLPFKTIVVSLVSFGLSFFLFYFLTLQGVHWIVLNILLVVTAGTYFVFLLPKEAKDVFVKLFLFSLLKTKKAN